MIKILLAFFLLSPLFGNQMRADKPGLRMLLHMNEGIGVDLRDYANTANGTVNGAIWVDGTFGKGLNFDGNNDYVSIPDFKEAGNNPEGDGNDWEELSVFAWMKVPFFTAADLVVISHYDHGISPGQRAWSIVATSPNNRLKVVVCDSGLSCKKHYDGSTVILDDKWHLVGFTWGNRTLRLYVDGIEETDLTKFADTSMLSINNSTAKFTIGSNLNNGTPGSFFPGLIDEAFIFDRMISAGEIKQIFTRKKGIYVD